MDILGKTIAGRYQLRRPMGESAYASSYKAYDDREGRPVVLKLLQAHLATNAAFLRRLRPAASSMSELAHPNIVAWHGFEQTRDHAFWVQDYVSGLDLGTLLRRRTEPLSWEHATVIAQAVGAALQHAHALGLYHGNLKPSNILIAEDGLVLVSDFGIAEWVRLAAGDTLEIMESRYMAPEQIGDREVDHRVDIYALASVFADMIGDRLPGQIAEGEEPPPSQGPGSDAASSARARVEITLGKALSPDPDERHASAAELMREVAGEPLADDYPPIPALTRLLRPPLPAKGGGSKEGLKRAAARLLAFFSEETDQPPALEPEDVEPVPQVDAAPDISSPAPLGEPQLASTLSWQQVAEEKADVRRLLQQAGAAQLAGDWEKVIAICGEILSKSYYVAAARVLSEEAARAQRIQSIYGQAKQALDEGDKQVAVLLAEQVLAQDAEHGPARAILEEAATDK